MKSCGFNVILKILWCQIRIIYTIVIVKISIRIWCEIKWIIFIWIILIFITIVKFVWKFCHFVVFFELKEKKKTNLFWKKIWFFFSFWIFDFFCFVFYIIEKDNLFFKRNYFWYFFWILRIFLYMPETNEAKWMQELIYKFSVFNSS